MDEIQVRRKEKLGAGSQHNVYNFEKFQDKIIKTRFGNLIVNPQGNWERISTDKLDLDEMKVFQENPDLFAKVFKVTERYAVIEKLDTDSILKDINDKVAEAIVKTFIMDPELAKISTNKKPAELTSQDFDGIGMLNAYRNSKAFIKGVLKYTSDQDFVIQLLQLINKAYNTITSPGKRTVDIHEKNVGYDKQGKVKLLDF